MAGDSLGEMEAGSHGVLDHSTFGDDKGLVFRMLPTYLALPIVVETFSL